MLDSLSIQIFIPDRNALGTQIVRIDDWNLEGVGMRIPRIDIQSSQRPELQISGVYFLLCGGNDSIESIYIGESINIKERLVRHINDYNKGDEEFYWHTAVFFGSKKLDTAKTRYLEDQWKKIFKKLGHYTIHTKKTYSDTIKNENDEIQMQKFIGYIKLALSKLEPNIKFEEQREVSPNTTVFYCSSSNSDARGFLSDGGFTVIAGSKINPNPVPSFKARKTNVNLRNMLVAKGIIVNDSFTKNHEFSSPSAASTIILGRPSNGNDDWKTKDKKSTLKETIENNK